MLQPKVFLASVNIYCHCNSLSSANFGEELDKSKDLSELVAAIVLSMQDGTNIEDALLNFVSKNSKSFGLTKELTPTDRATIKKKFKMASATSEAERRSKVAEACLDFGSHLLNVRLSTMTPDDAQSIIKELFEWFTSHNAFSPGNTGIAIHAISFGEQLLESRKTATVQEAVEAIQNLYLEMSEN